MKLTYWLAAIALGFCLIPLGVWIFHFHHLGLASDSTQWSNFGSYLGGVLSPVLAFLSFIGLLLALETQRKEASRLRKESDDLNYFNHAVKSLERAYEAIAKKHSLEEVKGGAPAVEPLRDRLAWLTCARLLLSAKAVSEQISNESSGLRALYAGEEEHWRHQFYEMLQGDRVRLQLMHPSYFGNPETLEEPQIEERSIRVIFEFTEWPDDKTDPIDDVPKYSSEELQKMKTLMSGVKGYVLAQHRFKKPDPELPA